MSMSPGRKARLKAKAERAVREQYVLAAGNGRSTTNPFLDANWDEAARKYIETGDEALKAEFPRPRQDAS